MPTVEPTVENLIDAAHMNLMSEGEFVTPTTVLSVLHNWLTAWSAVANNPEDQPLLIGLEKAYDAQFLTANHIQY